MKPDKAVRAASDEFRARRHQAEAHISVMVFIKGDPKLATETLGEVEVNLPTEESDGET